MFLPHPKTIVFQKDQRNAPKNYNNVIRAYNIFYDHADFKKTQLDETENMNTEELGLQLNTFP